MQTTTFPEFAHAMHNVPGRMLARHAWDAERFSAQKWVSELRPVKGHGGGAFMRVTVRFDDQCKNGHNTFSVTGDIDAYRAGQKVREISGGRLHEEAAKAFPELAHLIKWHLCSTDGPMHYVANTVYHAKENGPEYAWVYYTGPAGPQGIADATKERLLGYLKPNEARKVEGLPGYRVQWDESTAKAANLDYARSSACWPEATDEELMQAPEALTAALEARLPALLEAFRRDMTAAGFAWSPAELEAK